MIILDRGLGHLLNTHMAHVILDSSDSPSPQVLGFWDLGTGLVNLIHEEPWSLIYLF